MSDSYTFEDGTVFVKNKGLTQNMITLDIEIYDDYGPNVWAQAKYLVHGHDLESLSN